MAPRAVHFIRHAEGYHNPAHNKDILDLDLTPQGQEQYKHVSTIFPYFDRIDLVCASPIRRAIQTALITTEPYLQSGTDKILALPLAQEATDKPANTPSALTQLEQEFGDRVDWRRCMDVYVDYDSNAGTFAPDAKSLRARALKLRRFLRDRDEKEIVVVLHGDFLHYVTGDLHEDGSQAKGDWENTEFRSYRFFLEGSEDATLKETEESVGMRNAKGGGEHINLGRGKRVRSDDMM
jgi:broad specificity phosphatase PhoE